MSEIDDIGLIREAHEIHCMATVIWKIKHGQKAGYANHPEIRRWLNHTPALMRRYQMITEEMHKRGLEAYIKPFKHPDFVDFTDCADFPPPIEPLEVMRRKLQAKIEVRRNKPIMLRMKRVVK